MGGRIDVVDFGELRNKAEGMISEHDDKIKQGIDKVGDFVGKKIGHDKVNPIEEKLRGFVDSIGGDKPAGPAADPVTPPVTPPPVPPVTPPAV